MTVTCAQVSAIRGGVTVVIDTNELVPGDVVVCNTGEKLPADIRLVTSNNFKCDQSSLTGESKAVKKSGRIGSRKPLEVHFQ
jgi:P-type E1-E2 ATPase